MEKTRHPDLTRQRILEAGFNEMRLHGFQAASVANILADTKLTKGALYHHFPCKKDLGLAVVNEVVRAHLDMTIFRPLRLSPKPAQALLDMLACKAMPQSEIDLGCPLNNLMQEMSAIDEDFRGALTTLLREWQETVKEALLRGQGAGDSSSRPGRAAPVPPRVCSPPKRVTPACRNSATT
jgi:TetR/AcrR family transcriptional repressor of nem operon